MRPCKSCGTPHHEDLTRCPRTGEPVTEGRCGTPIDRYVPERLLGAGGMGAVYVARLANAEWPVALKLVHPALAKDAAAVGRFVREARAVAAMDSPNILRVYDAGVAEDGTPFMATELLEGEPLESLLEREGPQAPARAVALARELLGALSVAHAAGLVHRDVKPGNVFLARDRVVLLDFGLAQVRHSDGLSLHTEAGTTMGTPWYMPPEQARSARDVDLRADLYAVGAVLYELLSGRPPHEGATAGEVLLSVATTPARPLREASPGTPEALARVVDRALQYDPRDRWQSAAEFSAALADADRAADTLLPAPAPFSIAPTGTARPAPARPEPPRPAVAAPAARRTVSTAALGLAALALVAVGGGALAVALARRGSPPPAAPPPLAPPPLAPAAGDERAVEAGLPDDGSCACAARPALRREAFACDGRGISGSYTFNGLELAGLCTDPAPTPELLGALRPRRLLNSLTHELAACGSALPARTPLDVVVRTSRGRVRLLSVSPPELPEAFRCCLCQGVRRAHVDAAELSGAPTSARMAFRVRYLGP